MSSFLHILGMARLLRCTEGTIIGHSVVNHEVLIRHLGRILGLTANKIHILMNPADPQDVPRAMELLAAIHQIKDMPLSDCSPTEHQEAAIISVISNMCTAFLDAFTNINLDISKHLICLSKYTHICFALFRKN